MVLQAYLAGSSSLSIFLLSLNLPSLEPALQGEPYPFQRPSWTRALTCAARESAVGLEAEGGGGQAGGLWFGHRSPGRTTGLVR